MLDQQAFQVEGDWLDAIKHSNLSTVLHVEPDW